MVKYVLGCNWCNQPFVSLYAKETICRDCDSKLIDLNHPIFYTAESQELLLNDYTLADIQKLISNDMTYVSALNTLRNECNKLVDSF